MKVLIVLVSVLACAVAQNVVCGKGTTNKEVTVEDKKTYTFKTQKGKKYLPNTDCTVNYKMGSTCAKMSFSCTKFNTFNKDKKKCMKGDKLTITANGKSKAYCKKQKKGNPKVSSTGDLSIVFTSDKSKKRSTGAVCKVRCTEAAGSSTGSGFPDFCTSQLANTTKNILFLGNSYTYFNDLPGMVGSLATAAGFSATVESVATGGQTLGGHVAGSLGHITSGDWDVVVIQDQSQRPSFSDGYVCKNVIPEAKTIVDTIRAKNPCTVPVFFLTWGKRDGDTQNCANGNYFCTFEGIQDRLTKNYKNLACLNQPARVAPAGEAWRNYSNRDVLFVGDGSHPSAMGTYLTACTMLETIWGVPCTGNSYQPVEDAAALQSLASQTVQGGSWEWPGTGGTRCKKCRG